MFDRVKYLPLLLVAIAGLAMLIGAILAEMAGFASEAGFLGMYAAVAFLLSVSGYGFLFSIKAVAKLSQRRRSNA